MSYVSTSRVNVFPSSRRSAVASGKFTSESNLTNILRSITDNDSYTISYNSTGGSGGTSGRAEFVINGYYFVSDIPNSGNVWAAIRLDSNNELVHYETGSPSLDTDSEFKGLSITSTEPTITSGYYKLQVLSDGSLINQAKFKLNSLDLETNIIPVLNGGTGKNNLDNVTVGKAKKLNAAVGDSTHPVYVSADGTVSQVTKVAEAASADNSTTSGSASDVTSKIGGKNIGDIFEENGTTVKNATNSGTATKAGKLSNTSVIGGVGNPVYFGSDGIPHACTNSSISGVGSAATASTATTVTNNLKLGSDTVAISSILKDTAGKVKIAEKSEKLVNSDGSTISVGYPSQCCYFSNGVPTAGFKVFIQNGEPQSGMSAGDIWIKIPQ